MPSLGTPRFRVQRPTAPNEDGDEVSEGCMKLYSFYKPSLLFGTYEVKATDDITATHVVAVTDNFTGQTTFETVSQEPITLKNNLPQKFDVIIPQFSLPPGSFHSCYPTPGMEVLNNVLPHIVFNDPHLPWECPVSETSQGLGQTPWLALLVFTQDELQLTNSDLKSLLPTVDPPKQTATLSVPLTVKDFLFNTTAKVPILPDAKNPDLIDLSDPVSAIFLDNELFSALFTTYNDDGTLANPPEFAFLDRYQSLAHVRKINTLHMAGAGTGLGNIGEFSLVISHRTAPFDIITATDVIVHLVSLNGVQNIPLSGTARKVGLASLYNWTYKCVSKAPFSMETALQNVGFQANKYLQFYDTRISEIPPTSTQIPVLQRLSLGYSLVRYRTRTGDETVAFNRGPFAPVPIKQPPITGWPAHSNSGTDLQIFDQTTGIMDIAYSSAWQLGRNLAISDKAFRGSLTRLRTSVHQTAVNNVKARLADQGHRRKTDLLAALQTTKTSLSSINEKSSISPPSNRFLRQPHKNLNISSRFSIHNPNHRNLYRSEIANLTKNLASARPAGSDHSSKSSEPYNEHNIPASTDWSSVLKFVLDRLFMAGIPPHYLLPEPSYLPNESMRFFYVDNNWMDALIDGALSLANHLDSDDDEIRREIKENINIYLNSKIEGQSPQIPKFGFFLRSHIVEAFPDLKVTAPLRAGDNRVPTPFLQHMGMNILLCIFDRAPGEADFTHINIQQPAHQLSFSIGTFGPSVPPSTFPQLQVVPRHVWTVKPPLEAEAEAGFTPFSTPTTVFESGVIPRDKLQIYDWRHRTLIMANYTRWIKKFLGEHQLEHFGNAPTYDPSKPEYQRDASAALVGLQLNDWLWYLRVAAEQGQDTPPPRQLLVSSSRPALSNATIPDPTPPTVAKTVLHTISPPNALSNPPRDPSPTFNSAPRSPHLPRIRPSMFSFTKFPDTPEIPTLVLDMKCSVLVGAKVGPVPLDKQPRPVLLFSVSYLGTAPSVFPMLECIFELPLDIPGFSVPPRPPTVPPSSEIVPFLASSISSNINTGKGVLGNGQGWFNIVLERTDKSILLKLVAVKVGGMVLSPRTEVGWLLKEADRSPRRGCCLLSTTIVWGKLGGKSATRGFLPLFT
jgi:hypothetical protein